MRTVPEICSVRGTASNRSRSERNKSGDHHFCVGEKRCNRPHTSATLRLLFEGDTRAESRMPAISMEPRRGGCGAASGSFPITGSFAAAIAAAGGGSPTWSYASLPTATEKKKNRTADNAMNRCWYAAAHSKRISVK